jgi:glutamine synthetase
MASTSRGVGRPGFVAEHGLLGPDSHEAAEHTRRLVEEEGLRTVRMTWVDQHGAPRGKFMSAGSYLASLESGIDFQGAVLSMDSSNHVFPPVFVEGGGFDIPELTGFPDVVLVPDPSTFRLLPWADRTGWVLTDSYFSNGTPVPLDTRRALRRQVEEARREGCELVVGLEVELYILRRESATIALHETGTPPAPPRVSVFEHGYQYLSEVRLAGVNDVLERLRDAYLALDLPLRSMEDEWGPGQIEITFDPLPVMEAADAMVLFRSATKQVCERLGLLASFMCRPGLPNFFSSGWHLHESLRDLESATNAFVSEDPAEPLSGPGRQFVAGLLDHALPATVFSTPTINGYKRYRPYSFAPDRVNWGVENRGVMVRVQGGPGDPSTHLENRLGEPAANPYLYMATNLAAGRDGMRRKLEPPPRIESDAYASDSPLLPTSLWDAVAALEGDSFFASELGPALVSAMTMMKRHEIGRFLSEVTDWEMREYLEFY